MLSCARTANDCCCFATVEMATDYGDLLVEKFSPCPDLSTRNSIDFEAETFSKAPNPEHSDSAPPIIPTWKTCSLNETLLCKYCVYEKEQNHITITDNDMVTSTPSVVEHHQVLNVNIRNASGKALISDLSSQPRGVKLRATSNHHGTNNSSIISNNNYHVHNDTSVTSTSARSSGRSSTSTSSEHSNICSNTSADVDTPRNCVSNRHSDGSCRNFVTDIVNAPVVEGRSKVPPCKCTTTDGSNLSASLPDVNTAISE